LKEQLVAAVLDDQASRLTTLIDSGAPAEDIESSAERQWRVIARALLDGFPVGQLQSSFPGAARRGDEIRPQHRSDQSARLAAANAIALQLGGQLFEPFLRSATGLHKVSEAKLRALIGAEVGRLLQPH
jgi:TetR/AcrR family transcriptional regulator, repressor for neighboring sulfatase